MQEHLEYKTKKVTALLSSISTMLTIKYLITLPFILEECIWVYWDIASIQIHQNSSCS